MAAKQTAKEAEKNKATVQNLLKLPENRFCAECGAKGAAAAGAACPRRASLAMRCRRLRVCVPVALVAAPSLRGVAARFIVRHAIMSTVLWAVHCPRSLLRRCAAVAGLCMRSLGDCASAPARIAPPV
jgi:hypothetical protein